MGGDLGVACGLAWGALALPALLRRMPVRAPAPTGGARRLAGAAAGLLVLGALSLAARGTDPGARAALALVAEALAILVLAPFLGVGARDAAGVPAALLRGVAAFVVLAPAVVALNALNRRLTGDERVSEALADLVASRGAPRFWILLPTLAVAAPWFEEIFARGLLQAGLAAELGRPLGARRGAAAAIVVASLVFTALHEPQAYVPVFVLSLVLGAIAARTGGTAEAVGFHAAHNLFAVLYHLGLGDWFAARGFA